MITNEIPDIATTIQADSPINDQTLRVIAYTPTKNLTAQPVQDFIARLEDKDFMRLAVLLAEKGYLEGGCAIGAVVIDNRSRQIMGKGHNRHIQENRVYWHGETDAINDAGTRVDFSQCTLFTTLTPCSVCTALTFSQGFSRLVIGNHLGGVNAENEQLLVQKGVQVDSLEDEMGIALYARYATEKPEQDTRDWQGQAGVVRMQS
ncbi:MAG: nucleoside deaminase [Alphaproteobacteria bacterium]